MGMLRVLRLWNVRAALGIALGLVVSMALPSHRGGAQIPPTETLTFTSIADTYVQDTLPNANFNSDARLRADAAPHRIIYLRFGVSGINGRTMDSARVRLQVSGPSEITGGTIHLIGDNTWNEATMTWNTRPIFSGPGLHALGAVEDGEVVEFMVDGAVTGDGVFSFAIDTAAEDSVSYDSAVAPGGLRPELVLTVSAGPQPVLTIVQPPSGASFFDGDVVPLQATVTDDADAGLADEVEWTSDRDGILGIGSTVSPMLTLGNHRVTATVTDSDGFTGSDEIDVSVVPPPPDNTEPLVTITAPLDGQVFNSSQVVSFTGSATDLEDGVLTSGLTWTSDRDGVIGHGASFTRILTQGTHEVTATVTDSDSLEGSATVTFNVVPPLSLEFAPVADTYADAGSTGTNFGTAPELRIDASDQRISYLRFAVAGVGNRPITSATLRLEVGTDSAAASSSGGRVQRISDDTWQENAVTWNSRPTLDGTILSTAGSVDPGDIVSFDVTGAVTGDGSYNFALTTTSSNAVDYRSRESGAPRLILVLGGSPPTVAITAPANGLVVFTSALPLTFTATATDPEDGPLSSQLAWSSDLDGTLGTGASISRTLSVGTHRIRAAATDLDGLVGEAAITVRVRAPNVAPAVTITNPANGASIAAGTAVSLQGTATDDFDGTLSAQLAWTSNRDGALGTGASRTVTLTEGSHTLTASVADSDGATGQAQIMVTITPTAPVVTITAPAAGAAVFAGNPVTFAGTATDATDGNVSASLTWLSDRDGSLGSGAGITAVLSQGTHLITARAMDAGGLVGQATMTLVVRPPNALPQVTIVAPEAGDLVLLPLTLTGTATDAENGNLGASIEWRSDRNGVLGTGATLTVPALATGAHLLTATVTDNDGGTASASVTVTVGAGTLTLLPEADTYVDASGASGTHGSETVVKIDASPNRQSFLRFAVTGVAPFAVDRATLRLTVNSASADASSSGGTFHRISNTTWPEASTNWNNRPAIDGPVLATRGTVANNAVVDLDVTAAAIRDGAVSFAIQTTSSDAAGYRSREATTGKPQLILVLKQNTAPVVTITAPPAGTTVLPGASVTLQGTATDAEDGTLTAQLAWSSSIQGALGTGGSVTFTASPGQHTLMAAVTDSSGRRSERTLLLNVGSPPTVAITAPANGLVVFTSALPLTFTGTATDPEDGPLSAQLAWSSDLDGSLGTGATITRSLSVGTHRIRAAATDSDGLAGEAAITVRVRAPNVPPAVTITNPTNGAAIPAGMLVTLTGTATDDFDGTLSAQLAWTSSRDGALGTGATRAVTLSEGSHTLTASVMDSNGATGQAQIAVTITPTPPVVTITAPAAGATVFAGNPVTFTGTAADATDGNLAASLTWLSDRDGSIGVGASITTSALTVGTHQITARALDSGGLSGQAQITVVVRPPNALPQVTITAPADGSSALLPLTLTGTAMDAENGNLGASIQWRSDRNGVLGTGASLTVPTLATGAHLLTATVTDADGGVGTASVTVTVGEGTLTLTAVADTYVDASTAGTTFGSTTPLLLDASPVRQLFVRFQVTGVAPFAVDRATLRLTVGSDSSDGGDSGGTVHSITNTTWPEASTNWNNRPAIDGPALATRGSISPNDVVDFDVRPAILADGTYSFAIQTASTNGVGYRSREATTGKPQLILVLKQNTAPVVTITAPPAGTTVLPGASVILQGTATDAEDGTLTAQLAWSSSIQGALGTGGSVTFTASPGQHTLMAAVTDSSGRRSERTLLLNVGSPPTVTITAPANGLVVFTSALPLTFTGTANDPEDGPLSSQLAWSSDHDGALGTGASLSRMLSVGTHRIRAAATDSDSLVGEATITVRVRAPNTAPVVTITNPANGAAIPAGTPVILQGTATDDFDGTLSGQLGWTSSRDGALGTGASRTVTLTEGSHTLTASVTDSDGATGQAQITVTITPTAPVVAITAPTTGTTIFAARPLTFTGTATDATDGNLAASLTWTSDRDGSIGGGATFTTSALTVGTHQITARVLDSGGLSGQAQITVVVRPPNVLPQIAILAPADGATVQPVVTLSGTATDVEYGKLGAIIEWRSDRYGALGTGAVVTTSALAVGPHVLTATVTDLDGESSSASVTVTVRGQTLTFLAEADTFVDNGTPTTAYGSDTVIRIDADPTRQLFLRFPVTGVPPFAVQQAILRLTVESASTNGSNSGGTVHRVSNTTWPETTTSWNTRPTIDGPALDTKGAIVPNAVVDFNVTAALRADGLYSFAVQTTSSDVAGYRSREATTGRPQLILTPKENTLPVLAITAPPAGTVVLPNTSVTLSATATDTEDGSLTSAIQWTSDRSGPLGTGGSLMVTDLTPGAHVITAAVTDSSLATVERTVQVIFESTPVVTIMTPAHGSHHFVTEPVTFTATATDVGDGDLASQIAWTSSLDGSLGTGASRTLSSLSLGTHTITAAATDSRGLVGSAMITLVVEVNDPPTVSITAPAPSSNFVQGRLVTFSGTATDPEQGDLSANITWTSSRDGNLGTGGVVSTTGLTVGTHVITARILDNRSLQGTATVTITVEVNDPPVISITTPANGAVIHMAAPVAFSGGAIDPEDGTLTAAMTWTSSRDGAIGTGAGFSTSSLSIGTHTITARAVDTLNLAGTRQITIQIINDVPVVTVTSPPNNLDTIVGNPVAFIASAADTEDGNVTAGLGWTSSRDGALGSASGFFRTDLSQGTHTITAAVTDAGGATGTRQLSVTVRRIPPGTSAPVVTITSPATGSVFEFGEDTIPFTATAMDPDDGNIGASLVWTSNVNGVIGTGPSFSRNNLSIAMHHITATATDSHGVVRFAEVDIQVKEPNEPPVVTLTAPANGVHVNQLDAVTFSATAADLEDGNITNLIEWTSDIDGPIGTGATFMRTTLSPGTHLITASVLDSRGDEGSASVTLIVHAIPVVSILIPIEDAGYLDSTAIGFFATADDAAEGDVSASLVWTSNVDGPIGMGQSFTTDTLRLGLHTVTALATNSRGGVGVAQVSFFVGRDLIVLEPTAHAYVDQGFPSTNFGLGDLLFADAGPQVRSSFFRFAVTGIGPLAIHGADLRLTVSATGASTAGGNVRRFTDNGWLENAVTYNNRPTVSGAVLDTITFAVEADEAVDFDVTPAIVGDGTYTLALLNDSTDNVKYKSRESADGHPQLVIELAPPELEEIPQVTIVSPASGATVFDDQGVQLVATASDPEDGNLTGSIAWRSSRDGFLGNGGSLSVALSRGTHTITASVQDSFGLTATRVVAVNVVDRPPVVTISGPANGAFFPAGLSVTLSGSASDDQDGNLSSSIQWSSSRDGALGSGATRTTSTLSRGDHRITASVTNRSGTMGSASVRIFVDQAPPEVTILAPANGTTVGEGTALTLVGLATDVENGNLSAGIVWSSDREGALGTSASVPVSLMGVGTHRITAAVTDSHGFNGSAQIDVVVTAAPPVVTIATPATGSGFTGLVAFQGTAIDAKDGNLSSGLTWRSNVSGVLGTGASLPARQLSKGAHVITAQVTDSNGLIGSASSTIVVGAAAPTVRITAPVSSTASAPETTVLLGTSVTFTATATAANGTNLGSSVQWRSSIAGAIGTGASFSTSSLIRGRHVITARATDATTALTGSAQIAVVVTVTSTNAAPVVTITQPAAGTTIAAGSSLTFTATADDDATRNVASNLSWVSSIEGMIGSGASFTTVLYKPGTHTVTAMVADAAGFVGSASVSITVEAPSLTFEAVADTYSDVDVPTANFGAVASLRVDGNPEQRAYLRFTASGLAGQTIQSAVVRLQVASASGAASDHGGSIHRVVSTTWGELTLTHNNRPVPDAVALATMGAVAPSQTVDFNVSPVVTGDGTYSFAILPGSTDGTIYQSREASVGRPRLVVFLAPPARPAPTVDITAPANFATLPVGTATQFRATAIDAQDGDLGVAVIWRSNVSGTLAIGSPANLTLPAGPHIITATANDVDGNAGSDRIHVMVGDAPLVEITAPANNSSSTFGTPVVFAGSAIDLQDGDLTSFIQWSSSRDGALGTGPSFAGTLTPGTHTVTAIVTDSTLKVVTAIIRMTVTIANVGFRDLNFGQIDTANNRLTASKPESKLWYTPDGTWWGVLFNKTAPGEFHIYRLDMATQAWIDTGIFVDERDNSRHDTMLDGNKLYVLSRFADPPAQNRLMRYTYHADAQTYVLDPGFPANVPGGGTEAATIAKDSTGMLWTAFTLCDQVWMSHTLGGNDTQWAPAFLMPVSDENPAAINVKFDDISGVINMKNGTIGVFWSNQINHDNYFAVHTDGASPSSPTAWRLEVITASGNFADDHFNLKLASDGRLFVAMKTSYTTPSQTLIGMVVRSPTGTWSPLYHLGTVAQNPTRPLCYLDEVRRRVHIFYSLNTTAIYTKSSSMDTIAFPDPSGPGTPFIASTTASDINNPTGTKQNINAGTGYVAVASSPGTNYYYHNVVEPKGVPVVTITRPADGAKFARNSSVSFTGSALSYTDGVVSNNLTWTSNRDGLFQTGANFSTSTLSEGVHVITAAVTDGMGTVGSRTITVTVETDQPPVVTVASPLNNQNFAVGQTITFTGTAIDSLDGALTGTIQWTSSRDGALGTGGTITRSNLSTGSHTITAQATDSAGLVGSESVTIGVQVLAVPTVQFTAPAGTVSVAFGAPVPFAGTATDAFDGNMTPQLHWSSSRDGASGVGGSFTRSSLSRGTHTVTATVTDSHGTTGSATVTVIVN